MSGTIWELSVMSGEGRKAPHQEGSIGGTKKQRVKGDLPLEGDSLSFKGGHKDQTVALERICVS